MSNDNWYSDYVIGQMTGCGTGPYGAAGNLIYEQQRQQRMQQEVIDSIGRRAAREETERRERQQRQDSLPAINPAGATTVPRPRPRTKEEIKQEREQTAKDWDTLFANCIAFSFACWIIYIDVTIGIVMAWYGHVALVVLPALALGWFLNRMTRVTRLLRYAFQAIFLGLTVLVAVKIWSWLSAAGTYEPTQGQQSAEEDNWGAFAPAPLTDSSSVAVAEARLELSQGRADERPHVVALFAAEPRLVGRWVYGAYSDALEIRVTDFDEQTLRFSGDLFDPDYPGTIKAVRGRIDRRTPPGAAGVRITFVADSGVRRRRSPVPKTLNLLTWGDNRTCNLTWRDSRLEGTDRFGVSYTFSPISP